MTDEIYKVCEQLQEYADLEGAEFGEYLDGLISLYRAGISYGASEDFEGHMENELIAQLNYCQENYNIVEEDEPPPVKRRKYRYLEEKQLTSTKDLCIIYTKHVKKIIIDIVMDDRAVLSASTCGGEIDSTYNMT